MTKARLLWIDLEMTGLDLAEDRIAEVGVIATDFDFHKIATYQCPVKLDRDFMLARMTGDFWEKFNATRQSLITASTSDQAKSSQVVQDELIEFVQQYFDTTEPIYIAGNSVHQDRKFIEREWPDFDKLFSYRLLDVSAWKIIFAEHGRKFTKPDSHRAMDDIEGSIEELKYYLKRVKFNDGK